MVTELVGDHLSRGIDFMGIVCPGGQEVGDRMSGDQMGSGQNVSQPVCDMWLHVCEYMHNRSLHTDICDAQNGAR